MQGHGPAPSGRIDAHAALQTMTRLREAAAWCLAPARSFDECLTEILDTAIAITGAARGNVQLLERREGVLRIAAQRGFEEPFLTFFARVDAEHRTACGAAMNTRAPVVVEDVTLSPIFAGHSSLQVLLDAGVRSVVSTPLMNAAGELIGVISTHWNQPHALPTAIGASLELLAHQSADFLEGFRAEDGRRRDLRSLRRSEQRMDELLAMFAHELRNSLAPIRNYARFLGTLRPEYPDLAQAVRVIERQAVHMARLVDDLLDLSRAKQGTLGIRIETVEPFEIVQGAFELGRGAVDSRRQNLLLDVRRRDIPIAVDRERLTQVIGNLLSNASKYTPEQGRIEIVARREGDLFVFRVTDDGIGIAADRLATIFEPFARPDPGVEPGGLGIGLAVARRIVELHHGTIAAHSDGIGRGSVFTVRLPLHALPAPVEIPTRTVALHTCRILLVEDDPDGAESLARLLRAHDHVVRVASEGIEALRMSASFHPQVVLLDVGLPDLDGREVARRMRELPWGRRALFVAVSGWNFAADEEDLFDAHLVKPVDPDALLRWIDEQRSRARKD